MTIASRSVKYISVTVLLVFILAVYSEEIEAKRKKAKGGTIIWASIADASYLNPILATDSASGDINGFVYNGLVKYDKNLELEGDLAESWEVSEDRLKIIFHLRKDVYWHDGEKFDSEDVLYTYNVLKATSTRTPYSSKFDKVKKVSVPDKHTFIVEYSEPFSPALPSWGMGILPEHIFAGTDINTNPHNREPIGTGPYRFISWNTDDRIILESNEKYFEGEPGISRIVYKIIPDISVQFMELNRETIDWMSPTPDQWIKETSKESFLEKYNRYKYPSFQYAYMGYNLKNELFSDVRVRQAIDYAVNKQEIIDAVLLGLGSTASGPYPPVSWAYNADIKDRGYFPDKARDLLKAAGWKMNTATGILEKDGKPFSFTLMTNQGNSVRKLTCEVIQNQLKKIGIDVKIRIQEWSSFIHQYIDKRQFDAIIIGWSLSVDPDNYSIWHSSQQKEGQYNFTGYSNPEVDRLLLEGRREFDLKKRKEIYKRIHTILHEEQPYLFLYFADTKQVLHARFTNITLEKAGITHNFIEWKVPDKLRRY
ncbi:MAG: peptide-binding protein [Elusimicrobiota bacterium]